MGRPKPLLPFGERTAIELLIAGLIEAGIEEIVLILGPGGEAVAEVVSGSPVSIAWNCETDSDMASSLRIGTERLNLLTTGVLVALADHPLVATATLRALIARHDLMPSSILIPTFEGKKGHPILLPRPVLGELGQVPTLRDVVRKDPARVCLLPVPDPGILLDLDTPEEYLRGRQYYFDNP